MQVFDKGKVYDFMGKITIAYIISGILFFGSIGVMIFKGFNYGIDFTGGTLIQIKYDGVAPLDKIRQSLSNDEVLKNATVTEFGSPNEVIVRYPGSSDSVGVGAGELVKKVLMQTGKFQIRRVDIVGPKVGNELKSKAIIAVILSLIAILIYIAFRFEWRFSMAAIASEVHDTIITLGAISLFNIEVNLDTLAAILTVIGYSLNDTIIVFDRIREGVRDSKSIKLNEVINESVSATLSRTILTSGTTLCVVLILFIFGGDMIKGFSFTMLIGVISGTISTIFIASPMLLWFKFNVQKYREMMSLKIKKQKDKEKMRAMYEKGTV